MPLLLPNAYTEREQRVLASKGWLAWDKAAGIHMHVSPKGRHPTRIRYRIVDDTSGETLFVVSSDDFITALNKANTKLANRG
jgi:hypothetical protein